MEALGRNQDARFALDRLEQERAGVRSNGALQRLGVAERNRDEARREWSEAVLIKRLGGEAGDGGGAPVKIVFADDDFGVVQGDALAGVAPPASGLDGRLHGFRAGVHRQHHLHAAELREFGAEERELIVAEGARGERNPLGLFLERLDDARMAVALIDRRVGAQTVQIPAAVDVVDPGSASPLDHDIQRMVVMRAPPVLDGDEFFGPCSD